MSTHPQHPEFAVEPWSLTVDGLDLTTVGQCESIFALANGHVGMRGTLEEGEPKAEPGTYLNGFYEEYPYRHPEIGYGLPASGESLVRVTDGNVIRLTIGDAPFDLRYGTITQHEQKLDFRTGQLTRVTEWTSPAGTSVRVRSARLVSFTRRSIAAIKYEIEPIDGPLDIALQSDLIGREPGRPTPSNDPRAAANLESPLVPVLATGKALQGVLVHQTRRSLLRAAVGMSHTFNGNGTTGSTLDVTDDLARLTVATRVGVGETFTMVKYLAYGWSHYRSATALRDQVEGALATARLAGWDGLADEQRDYLDRFWSDADVEIDGDPQLQQAVRFALFHLLQATARAEQQAIPAKGLTGHGYDGHAFWDAETFVLPVLSYTLPNAARDALTWRYSILDQARANAETLGQAGAAFPWRTISGQECSGYWPAGTAAFHVNAGIADATARYVAASCDEDFDREKAVDLLVETARLWSSLGHFDAEGGFRIHGVTGPDEYTAIVNDNVYTNLMAARNLTEALAACERSPEAVERLGVGPDELDRWTRAVQAMVMPYDERLGVHAQSGGFTQHAHWDFEGTPPQQYPILLHFPYFEIYRKQIIKQADLVLAMHLRGDAFSADEKLRNFVYYEARTVRDSSLSAATQAVLAAEVGYLDLGLAYWREAALTDLHDLHNNLQHGLHIASLAGAWTAAVSGFGGMRDHGGELSFAPRLPGELTRLQFRMTFRGSKLQVVVTPAEATYTLLAGDPLTTSHYGESFEVSTHSAVTLPLPPLPTDLPPVQQPAGRSPYRPID